MRGPFTTEDALLREKAIGRSASIADILEGIFPTTGDPAAADEWFKRHPLAPLPPPAPPVAVFDRDRFTITATGETLDMLGIKFNRDGTFELGIDHKRFGDAWMEVLDAIEDAFFVAFASRRVGRALVVEDYQSVHFDFEELAAAGHSFDWETGAIHPPQSSSSPASGVRPLLSIHPDASGEDELLADHYLERGGAMLIVGQTGIGKSTIGMQFAVGWALGREVLGFEPSRNLAVLIVQAENADHDLARMRDGMLDAFALDKHQMAIVNEHVAVVRSDELTGHAFGAALRRHIREWRPDIVILDPLLAFVGGDVSSQEVASEFLRGVLQPIARQARVGLVVLHHTGKPPKDDRGETPLPDYIGLGSSELANWPRAIVAITRIKGQRGIFKMELGKRGQNLHWRGPDGAPVFEKTIAHSSGGIHWREIDATEQAAKVVADAVTIETLFGLVPADGKPIPKDALISQAQGSKIGVKKASGWLAELILNGRLHEWRVRRPRTNPAVLISRHPQPQQSDIQLPS